MRVDCALLSDSVTVREGLLHILGGGITRIRRPEYPAQLGLALAVRIMVHPTEAEDGHQLRLILQAGDGQAVMQLQATFGIGKPDDALPGEELAVSLPVPMYDLALPAPGSYSFELLIDGIHQTSVPFVAMVTEEQEQEL